MGKNTVSHDIRDKGINKTVVAVAVVDVFFCTHSCIKSFILTFEFSVTYY